MYGSYQDWHLSLHVPDDDVLLPAMLFFWDFWIKEADRISIEQGVRIPLKAHRTRQRVYFMCFMWHLKLVSFLISVSVQPTTFSPTKPYTFLVSSESNTDLSHLDCSYHAVPVILIQIKNDFAGCCP